MKRLLLIPALCGFFIAQVQAAATDIGFSPWTKNVKWYRAAAESDLSSLTPSADTGTVACAWAVAENTIHTYNGTSWTTGGPCSTGSGSSSTSPAYVTIVDSSGDSAMDNTANAVVTKAYVTESAATATAADVDAADTPDDTVITVDTGSINASRLVCAFLNTNVAANANIDEVNIILAPAGYGATGVPITYTEADFASPSGALLWVRTSQTAGADSDATPDTTLPELGVLAFGMDVGGVDSVTVTMSADAADAKVDAKCTFN